MRLEVDWTASERMVHVSSRCSNKRLQEHAVFVARQVYRYGYTSFGDVYDHLANPSLGNKCLSCLCECDYSGKSCPDYAVHVLTCSQDLLRLPSLERTTRNLRIGDGLITSEGRLRMRHYDLSKLAGSMMTLRYV